MQTLEQLKKAQDATLATAIEKAGSKSALARLLGVTPPAVAQWRKMPNRRLAQLQASRPEWFGKL
jgi:DNA-binding transcriptional regulator YdaS (Cro superfamily)